MQLTIMGTEVQEILDHKAVQHKIRRIAYQIYEANSKEDHIILAGIAPNGYILSQKLEKLLLEIAPFTITVCEVKLNKKKPLGTVTTRLTPEEYKNKAVVLIDDVLNSGTTLIYGVKHFLDVPLKRFKTAVLVNRNHKKYPIKADFKGISLSTSLQESISVRFAKNNDSVVLQ